MASISPSALYWELDLSVGEACCLFNQQRSAFDGNPFVSMLAGRPLLVNKAQCEEDSESE